MIMIRKSKNKNNKNDKNNENDENNENNENNKSASPGTQSSQWEKKIRIFFNLRDFSITAFPCLHIAFRHMMMAIMSIMFPALVCISEVNWIDQVPK